MTFYRKSRTPWPLQWVMSEILCCVCLYLFCCTFYLSYCCVISQHFKEIISSFSANTDPPWLLTNWFYPSIINNNFRIPMQSGQTKSSDKHLNEVDEWWIEIQASERSRSHRPCDRTRRIKAVDWWVSSQVECCCLPIHQLYSDRLMHKYTAQIHNGSYILVKSSVHHLNLMSHDLLQREHMVCFWKLWSKLQN